MKEKYGNENHCGLLLLTLFFPSNNIFSLAQNR